MASSNSSASVADLTSAMEELSTISPITVRDLKNQPALWYKIHVFIYDLRNFREIPAAQARLDSIVDASYIGLPYFTPTEVQALKSTKIEGDKTLATIIEEELTERLERRMKKRVESGDFRVCAAHDLAPIFEKSFDIKPRELAKDQGFLRLLENSGLHLKRWGNLDWTFQEIFPEEK